MQKALTTLCALAAALTLLTITAYADELSVVQSPKSYAENLPAHPTERTLAQIDLTAPYDVPTVDELSEALLGAMRPLAAGYLAACERYGVNVWAVVAKDSLESGYNTSYAATVLNNLGGWTRDNGEYMQFASQSDYIEHSVRNLKELYLTEGGDWHNGVTLADVNTAYNGSREWLVEVSNIWRKTLERRDAYRAEKSNRREGLKGDNQCS